MMCYQQIIQPNGKPCQLCRYHQVELAWRLNNQADIGPSQTIDE